MSFLRQLKERRIVQVVASYAVTGWVAIEVVGALVERSILPEVFYRVGLTAYLGGLAVSIVLGWYHGEKGRQHATPVEILLLLMILSMTGIAGWRTVETARAAATRGTAGSSGAYDLRRVGVLYFEDRTGGDLQWMADGLTESLIDELDRVPGLNVVSRSGAADVREAPLSADSIAALLSTGTLVQGAVSRRGEGDVRVDVSLVDGESGSVLESQQIEGALDEAMQLRDDLARQTALLLREWLGEEVELRRSREGTELVGAWVAHQRGERLRKQAEESIRAGDLPGFVAAHGAADSTFAEAAALDESWAEPVVMRAVLASRWAELSAGEDPREATAYLERALAHIDEALRRDSRSGRARQVLGTIHYLRWAYGLTTGPGEAESAFARAEDELEEAVRLDPGLANAWNLLSVIRSQESDLVGANLAARRALEEDEFLGSAQGVLRTLYATSYDLESFRDARRYCDEGSRRFPDSSTFTECHLWLMATRAGEVDVPLAWELADEFVAEMREPVREAARIRADLMVANILASAGMADSARAVIARAQAPPSLDPSRELLGLEALVHLTLGDEDTAVDRLRIYLTSSPEHREGWRWTSHWWWRELQDNEEYRNLIGL